MDSNFMQIPLLFGTKQNRNTMDYDETLNENMLAISSEIKNAAGYVRIMPGIKKVSDVNGVSRGVNWNTLESTPWRVMGNKIYNATGEVGDVPGMGVSPMAHSRSSVGVVADDKLYLFKYGGDRFLFSNWIDTSYNWGNVWDVCHLRQRYIFSQKGTDTFWCSDLEDETKPDKIAPAYRAESMPDGIIAIRSWRDYVVCFGGSSVEFFALTGSDQEIYQVQPSYTIDVGVIGRDTVCEYMDSFAFITSPSCGIVTVAVMNSGGGSWEDIASNQVKKLLEGYTVDQLAGVICERLYFQSHRLLLVHLPDQTLVYDHDVSVKMGRRVWSKIKTGTGSATHTSVHFMHEGNEITCGDKFYARKGKIDYTTSDQYGVNQEFVLYTPMINIDNAILSELEIDATSGGDTLIESMFFSASEDGVHFGRELPLVYNDKFKWLNRPVLRKLGRVRTKFSLKIRGVGSFPATLSKLRVRVT